jgi:hypothetical protein
MRPLNRDQCIREAVLLIFCDPLREEANELLRISPREWHRLLVWLDLSGLALYFLERLSELGWREVLPQEIVGRLQRNMADNAERTRSMIEESVAIQREFQKAEISYAVLKGLSLYPSSVPFPELRHQFDLDYLVAERSRTDAQKILEHRGYRLYAISGKSWEFKINERPTISIKDLYKISPGYLVELHIEPSGIDQSSRLSRLIHREMYDMMMPVLSPVDLFLGQGLHVFKDVCSAFSRISHLLEFYRHVLARRNDNTFWSELRSAAEADRKTCLGIGLVIYLITSVIGEFAPEALTAWSVEILPPVIRLWVDLYGQQTVFGKHPGTKLYLLLQKELEDAGVPTKRPLNQSLLPSRLPPAIIRASSNETLSIRIARYRLQFYFVFSRLRFHLIEGVRYMLESHRWRMHRDRLSS